MRFLALALTLALEGDLKPGAAVAFFFDVPRI